MRLHKAVDGKSLFDRLQEKESGAANDSAPTPSPSFKDERREAERKALEFATKRKAQAEQYPNAAPSEYKEGFKPESTDQERVIETASKTLKKYLHDIKMGGGIELQVDDFRATDSHNDVVDHSLITDKALISFAAKFATPKQKYKLAKFVVSYDYSSDKRAVVEDVFYDKNDTEYQLTSENLDNFLKEAEVEVMPENREMPLALYDYESERFEVLETPQNTDKVVARLKAEGFVVNKEYVDACHDPKQFGRMCYTALVPSKDLDAFKKIAMAASDDEWFNRSLENGKYDENRDKKVWPERALETGNYDTKKDQGDNWPNRALEGGKEGGKDYGSPYGSEAKMLAADARKKRQAAVKEALDKKEAKENEDILKKLDELTDLCK